MFKGSIVAIVTPFYEDGSINYDKLTELLNWHVAEGTNGIVILGTTGESATLSRQERLDVFKHTVKVINSRIPVIAGTGSNNTMETVAFSREVEKLGVDGLLVVTPYYNKGNNQGLIEHYRVINDSVSTPIIAYNVPSRTGVKLPLSVIKEIATFNNIVGLKEASGDLSYFAEIRNITDENFLLFSGNDDVVLPVLSLGGTGVISVAANVIPKAFSKMVRDYHAGNVKESTSAQIEYLDLINSLFIEVNPIPVKEVLNLMGKEVGNFRLPLTPCTEETREVLREMVRRYQL